MKNYRSYPLMIAISIIYAVVFGVVTNLFFDTFISYLWKPLVVALYFTVFTALLAVIIFFVARACDSRTEFVNSGKYIALSFVLLFVISMSLELIYEIGLTPVSKDTDSYIIVIDDSGSMASSDPKKIRESAINDLIADKENSFNYAVYTFASEYTMIRNVLPKTEPLDSLQLKTDGGTCIAATLTGIIQDINTGKLIVTENTRVLLLSDGSASDIVFFKTDLKNLLNQYVEKDMVISTIGLGDSVNDNIMKQIANYTGGAYVYVDEANKLSAAMIEASVSSADRNLLGFRGFCKTDTLHAVMRVSFLVIIAAVIALAKFITYGEYYKPQMIISGVCVVTSGLFVELSLESFGVGEGATRISLCVILALMIIRKAYIVYNYSDRDEQPITIKSKSGNSDIKKSAIEGKKNEDGLPETKSINN